MTVFSLLCLAVSTIFGWYICSRKYKKDLFNPANAFFLWQLFYLLAFVLFAIGYIDLIKGIEDPDLGLLNFSFSLVLYQCSFVLTYCFFIPKSTDVIKNAFNYSLRIQLTSTVKFIILFLLFVFLFSIYNILNKYGGLYALQTAMAQRGSVLATVQVELQVMYISSTLLVVMLTLFFGQRQKLVIFCVIVLFIVNIIFTGSRANSFLLLVIALVVSHYNYNKFNFKFSYLIWGAAAVVIFVLIALLRKDNALDIYINDVDLLFSDVFSNLGSVISRVSLINENIYIYSEYNLGNFWLGASYADLVYSPIPRAYYPLKPPIDEGVYVYSKYLGYNAVPSMPLTYLYPSSWPLKTESALYINFGYLGVVLGGVITAVIYEVIYKIMNSSKGNNINILWVTLYSLVIFGKVHLTNIGVVSLVPLIIFSITIAFLLNIKKMRGY